MKNIPQVGCGVLIIRNNKLLMSKRKNAHGDGSYGTAGGHLEFGETPEECVTREVFEETGLKIKTLTFLCVSNVIDYDKHYVDITFLATTFAGKPINKEPHKIESWDWYSLDKLPSPIFKPVEKALESYRTKKVFNS